MKYHNRNISEYIHKLVRSFPVTVITGARQVGKSTLLEHLFGNEAEIVVFDPLVDIEHARSDPDLFLRSHTTPLILDEIQYSPEIIPALKRKIDLNRAPGQYIISGSQQWQVMKNLSESLAGRSVFCDLDHFSIMEAADVSTPDAKPWIVSLLDNPDFQAAYISPVHLPYSLTEQLWRGFLPEAQFLDRELIPAFHDGYIRTYIERDVRQLEKVENLRQFRQFYQMVSACTGQEINYSQFGRDIGISPHTSQRWISILSGTFQVHEIPPFSRNTLKRISKKPKLYSTDIGLACHNLAISTSNSIPGHPSWGALFETACINELLKQCHLMPIAPSVYHWRTNAGAEVDLLIEYNGKYYPFEVKANSHPGKNAVRGIRSFRETYRDLTVENGYVITPVERVYQVSDTDFVVPWDGFYHGAGK